MTTRRFRVWGYVAGDRLPPDMAFNDPGGEQFRFTRRLPQALLRSGPVDSLSVAPQQGITWVGGTSRQTRVGSELAFNTAVEAADEAEAMHIVNDEVLPRYLATVCAVAGCPIYGVVVAAHPVAPPKAEVHWVSDSPTARLFYWYAPPPARIPDKSMLDEGPGLLWVATHDGVAHRAAYDLHVANLGLHSRGPDSADAQSILLTYYLVLERIANQVSRLNPQPPPATSQSAPHIDRLEQQLHEAKTVEAKVDAVKIAATRLRDLHTRGMKRQVVDAGGLLGISTEFVRDAGKFTTLRHARLAHASKLGGRSAELDDWLPRAQRCAMEYLSAYLRWVLDRGIAIPD